MVSIAVDNAAPLKVGLEKTLTQAMQLHDASLPGVSLTIPLEFAHTEVFRALPPSQQANIVTVLHRLPPLIGAHVHGGLPHDAGLLGALTRTVPPPHSFQDWQECECWHLVSRTLCSV